jgi:hypothetical protein
MMKLACPCGFATEDPQAFLDHCLATQHIGLEADPESGDVSALGEMFAQIQAFATAKAQGLDVVLPEGMEMNRLSREDILTDDELSEEQKQEILERLDALERKRE